MKDDTMKDIIEWDIPNWSRAIKKWNKSSGIASVKGKRVRLRKLRSCIKSMALKSKLLMKILMQQIFLMKIILT